MARARRKRVCGVSDGGAHSPADSPRDVSPGEAYDALGRLLASSPFRSAPQLVAFLSYIVRTTLEGRQHEIKGYTIAVEALGRPDDFDPVADPIVRVEAGRLRRAIEGYYAGEGTRDPVRIIVPRGSYVPRFQRSMIAGAEAGPAPESSRDPAPSASSPPAEPPPAPVPAAVAGGRTAWRRPLWLAALPLLIAGIGLVWQRQGTQVPAMIPAETSLTSAYSRQPTIQVVVVPGPDEAVNQGVRLYDDMLSDALARFDEFAVLKASTERKGAASPSTTFRLDASARLVSQDTIVSSIRLLHVASGRVIWTAGREFPVSILSRLDMIREVARADAVRLAQPYGLLHAELRANGGGAESVQCVIRTYDYWSSPSAPRHADVRDCLEATVKADPNYHPAWALLAMINLDEYRIGYNPRPGSALDRARKAAQHAVMLAPESARALQGLMAVLTVSGETDEALKAGFEAVRRNPFDTDILADLGARLTQAGRARDGRPLLLRAAEVNRARPVWHEFYLYLSARTVGDAEGVRSALKALELAEAPLALLAQAIAASDRGAKGDAMAAMRKLAVVSPVFGNDAGEFLDRAFFARDVRAMLLEALVRGGLSELSKG